MTDHNISADFQVEASAIQEQQAAAAAPEPQPQAVAITIDRSLVVKAVAEAIREVPPCGDQAYGEAAKLVAGIFAMEAATRELFQKAVDEHNARMLEAARVQARAPQIVPDIGGAAVQDLVPPLEADGGHFGYIDTKPEGDGAALQTAEHPAGEGEAPEDLNPAALETVEAPPAVAAELEAAADHEAQEAARRQEQEAAIAAQLAEASPLDAPAKGKGSRKAKISRLDGQDAGGEVSPLDLPKPAAAPENEG
jgi:hypothetical protein